MPKNKTKTEDKWEIEEKLSEQGDDTGFIGDVVISKWFVEKVITMVFGAGLLCITLVLILGLIYSPTAEQRVIIVASCIVVFLALCVFVSYLIIGVLKIRELEKINKNLESKPGGFNK